VAELKAQAVAGHEEKMKDALQDLFHRLFTSLNKAAIKLHDVDGVFRESLLGNIEIALEAIDTLNLTQDEDLIELAAEARYIMDGLTPDDLRNDKDLRKQTAKDTKELVEKMGDFF